MGAVAHPLGMRWLFAFNVFVSAVVAIATAPIVVHLNRPFIGLWFFLYVVSVIGGLYYHILNPRPFGAKPF